MKFNCDRCKTRYSISDERVRGKVLKIRCKNCSAVITVREGMSASAPRTPTQPASRTDAPMAAAEARPRSESALRGAFDDAMAAPSAADSMTGAPASFATEWYLAIDGNQSGPFDLGAAKGWIRDQAPSAELYCWSEGFDDWLPIEKVSQFRGIQSRTNGAGPPPVSGLGGPRGPAMPAFDAEVEKTPAPLFAKTMQQVSAEAPTLMPDDDPMSASYKSNLDAQADAAREKAEEQGGAFEFDIGEASRVVNLAALAGQAPGGVLPSGPAGLPGLAGVGVAEPMMPKVSGATSPELELPRPEVLAPATPKRSRILLPLLVASGALVIVLGVLLFLAFRNQDDGQEEITRSAGPGGDNLAFQYDNDLGKTKRTAEDETAGSKNADDTRKGKGAGTRKDKGTTKTNGSGVDTSKVKGYVPPSDEVDLTRTNPTENIKQGSLDPGDITSTYQRSRFSVNRCYERAKKSNPLLKVGKAKITLKVSTSGKATSVSIPSLSGEMLGRCLTAAIGRWRFPKSTEGFQGTFPIVFRGN